LDIPGAFSVVGEFGRSGGAKVLNLEDQDEVVAAVVIPRRDRNLPEENTLWQYFF
jgi:hypothetical protein